MRHLLLAGLTGLSLAAAAPTYAQTPPTSIAVDYTKAKLSWGWTQGTGGMVEEFRVKCGASAGAYTRTKVLTDPAVRSVLIKDVIGTVGRYFCVVTAANATGESGPSNEVAFDAGLVPFAPSAVTVTAQ